MSAVHFCTFGSIPEYGASILLLAREAKESGYFATVTAYTQQNIPATPAEKEFMFRHRRGYGYWIWKAIIIEDMMKKFPDGDIILYADAGCGISTTPAARTNMEAWISDCVSHPTHRISFQMPHIAEIWTKADVFHMLDASADEYTKTGQHIGGIQMYQNTEENRNFIQLLKTFMWQDNWHYVSDEPSRVANPPCFRDHRHDQSILSILFKKYGSSNREDHWKDPAFPVIALRRRYGF